VIVNDRMQQGYRYDLSEPTGRNFHPDFRPELTPRQMLELGVFGGKYLTDCRAEFSLSWFRRARAALDPLPYHADTDDAMRIAQTNIQLYNQLREAGRSLDELVLVQRAYELTATLYSGYYQADGKPFVAHVVGVASIAGWLDLPAEFVAVGLLHNVYGNGDFGDGRLACVTPQRARVICDGIGAQVEGLIRRFGEVRITAANTEDIRRSLPDRDVTDRRLLLVDLADHLEKYVDLGVLYFGNADWVFGGSQQGAVLVAIAHELGEPRLGDMLSRAFAETEAATVPAALRAPDGRRYLKLVIPRSCQPRRPPTLWDRLSKLREGADA
jgi:hypothetical protein